MTGRLKMLGVGVYVLLLVAVLAACNNTSNTASNGATGEENNDSVKVNEKTEKARIYKDFIEREVEIPAHPERVVALWSIGEMLELGQKPVGATEHLLRFYTEEEREGITSVGDGQTVNMEEIIALQPDLIVVSSRATEEDLAQYSKIAPTIVTEFFGDPIKSLQDMGEILNKQKETEQWITTYNERVEKARTTVDVAGQKAFVVQFALKEMYLYTSATFPTIFNAYEFTLTDRQVELEKDGAITPKPLSTEALVEFSDADSIFLIVNDTDSQVTYDELKESSIWQGLPAVKNNQVYEIGNRISIKDVSTLDWALDEVQRLLQEEQ